MAYVASVFLRLSARSRHFSLFGREKNWGERKKVRERKIPLKRAEKAYGNDYYQG